MCDAARYLSAIAARFGLTADGSPEYGSMSKAMSAGERDKMMNDIATVAATEYCRHYEATGGANQARIKENPGHYLNETIPYLTVRTLQRLEEILKRHETALKSLEADSRWIKFLTIVLVILTIVLAFYAFRLDTVLHSLSQ